MLYTNRRKIKFRGSSGFSGGFKTWGDFETWGDLGTYWGSFETWGNLGLYWGDFETWGSFGTYWGDFETWGDFDTWGSAGNSNDLGTWGGFGNWSDLGENISCENIGWIIAQNECDNPFNCSFLGQEGLVKVGGKLLRNQLYRKWNYVKWQNLFVKIEE